MTTALKKNGISSSRAVGLRFRAAAMVKKRRVGTTIFMLLLALLAFGTFAPAFAPLPSLSSSSSRSDIAGLNFMGDKNKFEIADDMFWKDGKPFQIIGGDLHYFRVLPEYWEDRLLRAKALGLNTIQTYVPWNLHEPREGQLVFKGIADIFSFLNLCQKLDLLVMLRVGPYICAEWDFGGFPAWLLTIEPTVKLRSSDPAFINLVERWWGILLPKIVSYAYKNGGPIIMVQIENEFGSYGDDKAYLHHLVRIARRHLGDDVILYTTDGGSRENLNKGTIPGDAVFSAVDFSTGDDPWPNFKLQKEFNAPGKSPPLSTEFYTGWLTHWGEHIANTDATVTASYLERILSKNGSAVLYMAHGGTNFGFYSGANTGADETDYKPDLTSYDYDAPIKESGDIDNPKYQALRRVIAKYTAAPLPSVPSNTEKKAYGLIKLQKTKSLFNIVDTTYFDGVTESENPLAMESLGQMFGFMLYVSDYKAKANGSLLFIPKVHDRAQVFISCPSDNYEENPKYVGTVARWSNTSIRLPHTQCTSDSRIYILVENMGRINYGQYIFGKKGILSPVYLDGKPLQKWKMLPIPFHNLNEDQKNNSVISDAYTDLRKSVLIKLKNKQNYHPAPAFYTGHLTVDEVKDTFLSFRGWSKGVAFINGFNLGRFWPSFGPQCNLYVPAPILQEGKNLVVILELEAPNAELFVTSVDHPDFTCGSSANSRVHQI
ncbi:beta-galactosidase 17 isoform X1 [Solanum stenotomum]|uniref:beta-galactosidase 17 isoform X1 n=2 Tax=Solanum stenotomum TaxID=172797 RepID=UPI0020D1ED4C|nr:beta-galactosidase 17 isoform X1 [Solanum stenotomum]